MKALVMQPFRCFHCGGTVDMRYATDSDTRHVHINGRLVERQIPKHVLIPKCDGCGDTYFAPEDSLRVDEALGADYIQKLKKPV